MSDSEALSTPSLPGDGSQSMGDTYPVCVPQNPASLSQGIYAQEGSVWPSFPYLLPSIQPRVPQDPKAPLPYNPLSSQSVGRLNTCPR